MSFGWSCRKDVEILRPYPNTLSELSQFLLQVPDASTSVSLQFNGLQEDKMIVTPTGLRVFFSDINQLFRDTTVSNNAAVSLADCNDLKVNITYVLKKGDMLARGLPTTSIEDQLLACDAMIYIQVLCGNKELQLMPGRSLKIYFPFQTTANDRFVYAASFKDGQFKGWKNTAQPVFEAEWPDQNSGSQIHGYELVASQTGWISCARQLIQTGVAVTPFCIDLEPGYTALNTQSYLLFDNINAIAPLEYDPISHSFCFPNIPAGFPVKVVSVARLETDYWLGVNTTESGTNSMLPVEPEPTDALEILNYLRGL